MTKLNYNLDDIKDFKIASGKYRLKLTKVEQGLSKKQKPQLILYFKIVSGEEKGKELRYWSSLEPKALVNLKNVLTAFGFDGLVKTDTQKLVGRTLIAVVGETTSVDKNGNDRVYANILSMVVDTKNMPVKVEEDDDDDDDDDEVDDDDDDDDEEPAPVKKSVVLKKKSMPF